MGIVVVIIAAALFGQQLWSDLFDLFKIAIGGGVTRAATNDGLVNAVRMYKGKEGTTLEGEPSVIKPPEEIPPAPPVEAVPHPQTFPPFPS